ncbi:LOW QUALITY PROTEIN: hypothetical protein DH2020_024323 [Rehmannia glutinosa]|uniref:FAS1 domain-containing protein n=1 Tax=Rehmannia glutinosa TaxID=99300 RepID=A0ABR0W790_REHGL
MDHILFSLSLSILLLSCTPKTQAQTPAPSPAGPTNITQILEKAGQFTTLIRLFKITQVGDQINTQLNNSGAGLTVFAPTDNAFSGLPPNPQLTFRPAEGGAGPVPRHPGFPIHFQTVSNPLRTQAGDSAAGNFPLNVTTAGNQVNVSTGVNDATVANTIYSDSQLAVYQVDKSGGRRKCVGGFFRCGGAWSCGIWDCCCVGHVLFVTKIKCDWRRMSRTFDLRVISTTL